MSIVEQATQRLEQLRKAGIEVPGPADRMSSDAGVSPFPGPGHGPRINEQRGVIKPLARAANPAPPRSSTRDLSREVTLDLSRLRVDGYLTPDDPGSGLAEELRALKRPIIDHVRESRLKGAKRSNLIMVSSALPGDGKTYCAINLAISIAMEVDHSVLLVDADVVRPTVPERLGVDAGLGLLDVLTNPTLDLSEVMLRTNVPKLSLLPAGTATAKSTELLASATMEALLTDLETRYADRIVIFDSPPLLATSESRILASRMGQVLMVVQANRTQQDAVAKAFAGIASCETVWCVLNGATADHSAASYGYGHSRQA